jgi:hypothetical protein
MRFFNIFTFLFVAVLCLSGAFAEPEPQPEPQPEPVAEPRGRGIGRGLGGVLVDVLSSQIGK